MMRCFHYEDRNVVLPKVSLVWGPLVLFRKLDTLELLVIKHKHNEARKAKANKNNNFFMRNFLY